VIQCPQERHALITAPGPIVHLSEAVQHGAAHPKIGESTKVSSDLWVKTMSRLNQALLTKGEKLTPVAPNAHAKQLRKDPFHKVFGANQEGFDFLGRAPGGLTGATCSFHGRDNT